MASVKSAPAVAMRSPASSNNGKPPFKRSPTIPTIEGDDDLSSLRTTPPRLFTPMDSSTTAPGTGASPKKHKLLPRSLRKSISNVLSSPTKKRSKRRAKDDVAASASSPASKVTSLAIGSLSVDCRYVHDFEDRQLTATPPPPPFDPQEAFYMRVSDLDLHTDETVATLAASSIDGDDVVDDLIEDDDDDDSSSEDVTAPTKVIAVPDHDLQLIPFFHHASPKLPPKIKQSQHHQSTWVALDTGVKNPSSTPIAPLAVSKLVSHALSVVYDSTMWTPDHKTEKHLSKKSSSWHGQTFHRNASYQNLAGDAAVDDLSVLVWSGSFSQHGHHYGSEIPCIRAAGIVPNMSCGELKDLLVDSSRVKEYNSLSLGRTDLVILDESTKIVRSESKPPLVRSTLVLSSLLHVRELDGGTYIIVTRGVHPGGGGDSEILLGVNILIPISGSSTATLMINVNHIYSTLVPLMIAKRIGVTAATGFFGDVRRVVGGGSK